MGLIEENQLLSLFDRISFLDPDLSDSGDKFARKIGSEACLNRGDCFIEERVINNAGS